MRTRHALLASALFLVIGPGFEAGLGPFLLTGFDAGDAWGGGVRAAGWALAALGAALLAWCYARFPADGRGTPSPALPTSRLVVRGPYAHVRNPMYVATTALIAGEGLGLARPVLLVAALAYLVTLALVVRLREERMLRERFGSDYDAYARAVPGWVPRPR